MKQLAWSALIFVLVLGFGPHLLGEAPTVASAPTTAPGQSIPQDPSLPKGCILFDRCLTIEEVLFNHSKHESRNTCEACHASEQPLFAKARSTSVLLMTDMYAGKTCGACHNGKKAFSAIGNCQLCHNYFKP